MGRLAVVARWATLVVPWVSRMVAAATSRAEKVVRMGGCMVVVRAPAVLALEAAVSMVWAEPSVAVSTAAHRL